MRTEQNRIIKEANRPTCPKDVSVYAHRGTHSKYTHCISNYSHNVSTGVETVNISKKVEESHCAFDPEHTNTTW